MIKKYPSINVTTQSVKNIEQIRYIHVTQSNIPYIFVFPLLVSPSDHNTFQVVNIFLHVLDILETQLVKDDFHVSAGIHFSFYMGNLLIREHPWYNTHTTPDRYNTVQSALKTTCT